MHACEREKYLVIDTKENTIITTNVVTASSCNEGGARNCIWKQLYSHTWAYKELKQTMRCSNVVLGKIWNLLFLLL